MPYKELDIKQPGIIAELNSLRIIHLRMECYDLV